MLRRYAFAALALASLTPASASAGVCDSLRTVLDDFENDLASPTVRGRLEDSDAEETTYEAAVSVWGDSCAIYDDGDVRYVCSRRNAGPGDQGALASEIAACPLQFRGGREDAARYRRPGERTSRFEVISGSHLVTISIFESNFRGSRRVLLSLRSD